MFQPSIGLSPFPNSVVDLNSPSITRFSPTSTHSFSVGSGGLPSPSTVIFFSNILLSKLDSTIFFWLFTFTFILFVPALAVHDPGELQSLLKVIVTVSPAPIGVLTPPQPRTSPFTCISKPTAPFPSFAAAFP